MNREQADHFTKSWTNAWCTHDLEAILDHFSDDVENSTPLIKSMLGIDSGITEGKPHAAELWKRILDAYPEITIHTIKSWKGVNILSLNWKALTARNGGKEKYGTDTFFFNQKGKVFRIATTHETE